MLLIKKRNSRGLNELCWETFELWIVREIEAVRCGFEWSRLVEWAERRKDGHFKRVVVKERRDK